MVSRYHWVTIGGGSVPWVNANPPTRISTVAFPAGAQLRKILVNTSVVTLFQSAQNITGIANSYFVFETHFSSGVNSGREVYNTKLRIPASVTSLYDPATLQRIYSQYCVGGDKDIGVDYQCHWNKATDPAFNLTTTVGVVHDTTGGANPNSTGQMQVFAQALYYL